MKNHFFNYYLPTKDDFDKIWTNGLFVFDANVLLNTYSYPKTVEDAFFSVLDRIKSRIWVPFHVGVEFHRNRFSRINQSNKKVHELLNKIEKISKELEDEIKSVELEKRNIGIDNVEEKLKAVREAHSGLLQSVQLACDQLPLVSLEDRIADKVCAVFEGKIGLPPENQASLDLLVEDSSGRFEKQVPPGFCDQGKDGTFRFRGIDYHSKHGDLIIWKQLLDYVKSNSIKEVVFVTGDKKGDWWLRIREKTLGPHPDLVEEAVRVGGVEHFWMYSADQFLEYSESYLSADEVTPEVIEQVRDVSRRRVDDACSVVGGRHIVKSMNCYNEFEERENDLKNAENLDTCWWDHDYGKVTESLLYENTKSRGPKVDEAEYAVMQWLSDEHGLTEVFVNSGFPDIIAVKEYNMYGFVVEKVDSFKASSIAKRISNIAMRMDAGHVDKEIDEYAAVLILGNEYLNIYSTNTWEKHVSSALKKTIRGTRLRSVVIGVLMGSKFVEKLSVFVG